MVGSLPSSSRACLRLALPLCLSLVPALCLSALTPESKEMVGSALANSQLALVENKGQWDGQALFHSQAGGLDFWITNDGAVMDFHKVVRDGGTDQHPVRHIAGHVLRMSLLGGKTTAVGGLTQLSGDMNYFVGDRSTWATNVHRYAKVRSANPYDGISVEYSMDQASPRYDFVVGPGADPSQIAIKIDGADAVSMLPSGNLGLKTSLGVIEEGGLVAYQETNGQRTQIPCGMETDGNVVRFKLGAFDQSRALVIDPLVYSTYLGADGCMIQAMVLDSSNDPVVTGTCGSLHFPITSGAYQQSMKAVFGESNAFVTKLKSDGSNIVFGTLLGGSVSDNGVAIALDSSGNPVIAGSTESPDFPTTPDAFQTKTKEPVLTAEEESALGGSGFVAKLNSTGTVLLFSTYLSGSGHKLGVPEIEWGGDLIKAMVLDAGNEPVICGTTYSADFPVTPGAYQTVNRAFAIIGTNGFITKVKSDGTGLVFGTFIGGASGSASEAVALDKNGLPIVGGVAESSDFPTTTGAYLTKGSSTGGITVTKFNAGASALVFSTYVGGYNTDDVAGIAMDSQGNPVFAGNTLGEYPSTSGAYQTVVNSPNGGPYVTKLKPDGSGLIWSTFLGTSSSLPPQACGLKLDKLDHPLIYGVLATNQFPTTSNAYETALRLGTTNYYSSFATELTSTASALVYSTLLPANAQSGAFDSAGNIVLSGYTEDSGFPTTPGAYEPSDLIWKGYDQNGSYSQGQIPGGPAGFVTSLSTGATGPSELVNLTVSPNPIFDVAPGEGKYVPQAYGTVTLSAPVSAETHINLDKTGPITLPGAYIIVYPGNSTGAITVAGTSVSVTTQATITAFYNGNFLKAAILVVPNGLRLLTVPDIYVYSGDTVEATITLQIPNPQVETVSITANPLLSVPATVACPVNSGGATFPIKVQPVATATPAPVFANLYGGIDLVLNVNPNDPVSTLSLSPGLQYGDGTVTGTVHLSSAAPTGGIVVSLSGQEQYSAPTVSFPAEVMIPAGSTSASFPIVLKDTSGAGQELVQIPISAYSGTKAVTSTINDYQPQQMTATLPSHTTGGDPINLTVGVGMTPYVVNLVSNNAHLTVPATMKFTSGTQSQTVTLTTTAVPSIQTAIVTAGGALDGKATAAITLYPNNSVKSLVVAHSTVVGGQTLACTLSLSAPANALGLNVNLSSPTPGITFPKVLSFTAGAQHATFNITTSAVTNETSASISATCSITPQSTTFTINP